jgi:DNA-binding response OmpR family regulator
MKKRILVVEDESLLALDIADQLTDAGFEVVGPATSVKMALCLIHEEGCDAAVLDVNLGNETVDSVAFSLQDRGVPFFFLSGNSREQLPAALHEFLWVSKPVSQPMLLEALHRCMNV